MATAQASTRRTRNGNGHDKKAVAANAVRNDLKEAKDAAETFVSAVKSSATHLGEHLSKAVDTKVSKAQQNAGALADKANDARTKLEDKVREHPMMSLGIAAGAGLLLAVMTRR